MHFLDLSCFNQKNMRQELIYINNSLLITCFTLNSGTADPSSYTTERARKENQLPFSLVNDSITQLHRCEFQSFLVAPFGSEL